MNRTKIQRVRPNAYLNRQISEGPVDDSHLAIIGQHVRLGLSEKKHFRRNKVTYNRLPHLIERLHRSEHYLQLGGVVLEDEGLFKTFPRTMLSYLNNESAASAAWLARRAFIIFEANPAHQANMIISRRLNRVWSRRTRLEQEHKCREDIQNRMHKYSHTLSLWADLKEHFKRHGVPYVVLDPDQGVSFNGQKIGEFVSEIAGRHDY